MSETIASIEKFEGASERGYGSEAGYRIRELESTLQAERTAREKAEARVAELERPALGAQTQDDDDDVL